MHTRLTFKELQDLVRQFEQQPPVHIYALVDCHLIPIPEGDYTPADYGRLLGISPDNKPGVSTKEIGS